MNWYQQLGDGDRYTNSINDCNTSLGKDAMNRVSTNGQFIVKITNVYAIYKNRD
ncbi:hypothetical protein [Nostoc sp.]|uniref:hypothetical protein n=1 Tax=Nostoc sp. TaxID=1180 RepID=UPI002FF4DA37